MRDLRRMGATNVLVERRRTPLRRATLHAHGGDLRASASPIPTAASARPSRSSGCRAGRRIESQQQPLQAGLGDSARLADALGTQEIPTGEKPGG